MTVYLLCIKLTHAQTKIDHLMVFIYETVVFCVFGMCSIRCVYPQLNNNNLCFFRFLHRHPSGLLPGAAASQHSLVPDQRHVAGRGALPGLPVASAGLRALSPLHEPRRGRARLPHPPQAGRVWNLHDQHAG